MTEILPVKGSFGLLLLSGNTNACSHWSQTINGYKWANEENKAKLLFYHPLVELIQDLHGILNAKGRAAVTTRHGKREILSLLWFFLCSRIFTEPVNQVWGVEGCTYIHIRHQWFSAPSSYQIWNVTKQVQEHSLDFTQCFHQCFQCSLQHIRRLRQRITADRELMKGVNITFFLEPEGYCVASGYKLHREVEPCRRRGVCVYPENEGTLLRISSHESYCFQF